MLLVFMLVSVVFQLDSLIDKFSNIYIYIYI